MSNYNRSICVDTSCLPIETEPIFKRIFQIFKRCVTERCGAAVFENKSADYSIAFKLDSSLEPEAFSIADTCDGVVISGSSFNALIFGMGSFLHKSNYSDEGFFPSFERGKSSPRSGFRAVYFALHFFNWYHRATHEELVEYLEDLMLWGYNTLVVNFPRVNLKGWDDPSCEPALNQLRTLYSAAKVLNMKTAYLSANQDFNPPNPDYAADKSKLTCKNGNLICTGTEDGYKYYEDIIMHILRGVSDIGIDYMICWPYDEGGCCCEKCFPWGSNGFYRTAKRLSKTLAKELPGTKIILSTWLFAYGINDPRDYELLYEKLEADIAAGDKWLDGVLIDTPNASFPEFVLKRGAPAGLPVIAFPEISMIGHNPWGGFGAVVTPERFEKLFAQYKSIITGCAAYSEGIFEDLNKAVVAGLFWDSSYGVNASLADYISYEYSSKYVTDILRMISFIEKNHALTAIASKKPADMNAAKEALAIAEKIDAALSENIKKRWRWRILYARPVLDYIRYSGCEATGWDYSNYKVTNKRTFWGDFLEGNVKAETLMRELIDIYHALEYDDPSCFMHNAVRPPLRNKKTEELKSSESEGY